MSPQGLAPDIGKLPVHGRLHHVAVLARDLDAAVRFYRDVLGLALEQIAEAEIAALRARAQ